MGNNSQTTNQSQSSQFSPWGIAIPGLTNLVNQMTGLSGNTSPTSGQTNAVNTLQQEAGGIPTNSGQQGSGVVSNLLNSSTTPNQTMWGQALNTSQGVWNPILTNPNFTNPMNTPGFGTALSTLNTDITNQVNGQFAAAGRDMSPANSQALARGLSQGEGGLIANEANALQQEQLGAANSALSGAGSTASGMAQLQQLPYMNQLQAMSAMGMLPGLYMQPGQAQLGAANASYGLPWQNLQMPLSLLGSAGGLGGSSSGYGTSTTTQPVNPWTTGAGIGLGLLALSDERLKENIEPIGVAFNGTNIYRYNFKGSPRTEIGVLAQEVEKTRPDAVVDVGLWRNGPKVKMVDYAKATEMPRAA